jgi:ferredoxin
MATKIKIDRDLCIGAGTCVVLAPNTFELDDELKAVLKEGGNDTNEDILAAAKSCPVLAIILEDPEGKQIYP